MVTKGNSSQGLLYVMVRSGQPHGPMLLTKSKYHHTFDQGCELFLPCLLLGQRVGRWPWGIPAHPQGHGYVPSDGVMGRELPLTLMSIWELSAVLGIPSHYLCHPIQVCHPKCTFSVQWWLCFRNLGNEINAVQDRRSTASRSPSQVPRNQSASMCCYNNIALSF